MLLLQVAHIRLWCRHQCYQYYHTLASGVVVIKYGGADCLSSPTCVRDRRNVSEQTGSACARERESLSMCVCVHTVMRA